MPDYIYLLENRLSVVQQNALRTVRDLAREAQMTVFLTGDAVRDLTCGNPVRDLEVVVHGNALSLKSALTKAGAAIWGEDAASRSLYLCLPGNVRLDLGSAYRAEYPKSGKPVYHWSSIQEDLRSRDFTVNAMAISLNEGSYGLLMDPTNGVADIEARLLRLVSNYGFLDNPALLIRATRLKVRLGFELEERTQIRYENAKGEDAGEGLMAHLSAHERSSELEQIGHEEEPLKVLHALETEGWMAHLFPGWTAAKADVDKLTALHDLSIELQVQGVHPDVSAAQMQLLTAKLQPKDLAQLKKSLLRPGFVEAWDNLDASAAAFAKVLLAKENATPSATYTLFTTYAAEAVLWLGFTSKQAAVKEKYENFLKVWPQARQRIPYALMAEMRIVPELPGYQDLVKTIFLQLIDGGLTTTEEIRALLEPHSPPAPPPPVTIKRTRAKKGADAKSKARLDEDDDEDSDGLDDDEEEDSDDLDGLDLGGDDIDLSIGLDDARTGLPVAEGEEDDVFATSSVGDEDLDADDDTADSDDDDPDDEPPARKGRGAKKSTSRSSARSESRTDSSTAFGAGLKALALKLDLEEPSDPADLDEADPTIDVDDPTPPRAGKQSKAKAALSSVKAPAAKAAPSKTPTKAAIKTVPKKTAKSAAKAPAKAVAKAAAKPAASALKHKTVKAKPAPAKATPAKVSVSKSTPAKTAPAKVASAKSAAAKSAKKRK